MCNYVLNMRVITSTVGILFLCLLRETESRGTCKLGEFRCENGECIPKEKVCNSERDCPSGIDEYVCTPKFRRGLCGGSLRKPDVFQCKFGGCIPMSKICDGAVNCLGGSDESEICENNSCLPGQFRCKYGACIDDWKLCDGRIHCPDGSDETPEACKYITCKSSEFRCRYGGCIQKTRICDLKKHCADGSDEFDFLCLITRAKMVEQWGLEGKQINDELDQRVLFEKERRITENTVTEKAVSDSYFHSLTTTTPLSPLSTTTEEIPGIPDNTIPNDNASKTPNPVLEQFYAPENQNQASSDTKVLNCSVMYVTSTSVVTSTSFVAPKLPVTTETTNLDTNSSGNVTFSDDVTTNSTSENINSAINATPDNIIISRPPSTEISTTTSSPPTTENKLEKVVECVLPEIPENSEASIPSCLTYPDAYFCKDSSKTVPFGAVVQFECSAGYFLYGPPAITCRADGTWSGRPPECDPLIDVRWGPGSTLPNNFDPRCPPLTLSREVRVECIEPKRLTVKSCGEKQMPGTEARFTCAPYYRPAGDLPTHYEKCGEDGQWSPGVQNQFSCVTDCGLSEVPKTPYILNGKSTKRGQWPWHVAIYLKHKGELKYICGGALVTDQAVLTSAHCVTLRGVPRNASDFLILLGKQKIALPDTDPFVQKRWVSKIFVEDSFNYIALDSDIAILSLNSPAISSFYVRPVCYPQASNSFLEEYQLAPGNLGTVVGFGFTENGTMSDELRMTELPVVSATECADSSGDLFAGMTRSTNYCAGYKNGTQVCNGDSGGGQYFRANVRGSTRWYIQGLVSYGVPDSAAKLCKSSQYAIFNRVGRYSDWIVRTLSRERLI